MAKPEYTLTDYVRWKGGYSFDEIPFCDTDALVLCNVIYFDIFSGTGAKGKAISELIHDAPIDKPEIVKSLGGGDEPHVSFIRALEESRRFGPVILKNYSESFSHEKSVQFAAADFCYRDKWNFIAYRGTDDSIAGWKEDFMLSFTKIPAQELALDFAQKNLSRKVLNFIGGHSKGGNLAIYAAAMLPKELQSKLNRVYDLDGPGFCPEVFDMTALDDIREITTFIIPEFSVIGRLFEPDFPDTRIVTSDESAMMQHKLLSWGVDQNGLETVPENDPRAQNINRLIDDWLVKIPQSDREIFVSELFDALASDGSRTMTDIMKKGADGFEKILFQVVTGSSSTKKTAAALPEQAFFGNTISKIKQSVILKSFAKNGLLQSLVLILTGCLFIYASQNILNVASILFIISLAVIQAGITFKRFRESHWRFAMIRERLYLTIILVVLSVVLIIKDQAMFIFGSIIFSVAAFVLALHTGVKISEKNTPIYRRILSAIETVLCVIYGLSYLIIPQETVFAYALSIGNILIIDGILRGGFLIWEALKS